MIGDVGVRGFGVKASGGKRSWVTGEGADPSSAGNLGDMDRADALNADAANKLYVGLLIMLIFSEALAL